jgi:hypothetical protein
MIRTPQWLKNLFITGYKPTQQDFNDLFDSFISKTDGGVMSSSNFKKINVSEGITDIVFETPFNLGDSWGFVGKPFLYNSDGDIGYSISNESYSGFRITSSASGTLVYKVEKL